MIKAAPRLHQIKGKPQAIQYALEKLGIHADVLEWFEASPELEAGTHEITAYVSDQLFEGHQLLSAKAVRQIWRLINKMKRWSQKTELKIGERFATNIALRAGTHVTLRSDASLMPAPSPRIADTQIAIRAETSLRIVSSFTHEILTREAA